MKSKIDPLNSSIVKERANAASVLYAIDESIEKRIDYIINTIYKSFGKGTPQWYFNGASEGDIGQFDQYMFTGEFNVYMSPDLPNCGCFLTRDGGEWAICDGIPSRWLFEDFEKELSDGIVALAKKEADAKVRAAKKKLEEAEKEKALIESVKNKLTTAELKALLKKKNQKEFK